MAGYLAFRDCTVYNDLLFFITEEPDKWPLCMDLKTGKISVWSLSDPDAFSPILVDRMINCKELMIGISANADCVVFYDSVNGEIEYCKTGYYSPEGVAFANIFDEKIYIFEKRNGVIIFDINQKTASISEYPKYFENCFVCGITIENDISLIPKTGNTVLKFNTLRNEWDSIDLGKELIDVSYAVAGKEGLYIIESHKSILLFDGKESKEICNLDGQQLCKDDDISRICVTSNNIIMLPFHSGNILNYNKNTRTVTHESYYPSDFRYDDKMWGKFYEYGEDESYRYYAPRISNYLLKISKESGTLEWLKTEIDPELSFRIGMMHSQIIKEKEPDDLKHFISVLTR